ncbi:MAG: diacylglycerol kinase family protein [Prosthecobacter sp.]|jgi:diacylglycerol kinase|uniref:diacylglycerol kinase family protein n=1 Tax=Prosthecobacter sp. TaxID=1965333 RepID=UPI0019EE4CBD|nr:diacylglycerol kinase family protein [Prosthecobacter sp.]MBE2282761.1 diacylglycerol kinase family protein [Prosthecobacter sp.]
MLRWFSLVCRSFGPALAGLFWAVKTQRNVQVHAIASAAVVVAGIGFGITNFEWCAVILAAGLVWAAELLNTAIEVLSDRVSSAREEAIRRVKDVAAAAVLMAALAASAVGLMVFFPRLLRLF